MDKMLTGYLIDVANERAEVRTVPDSLDSFYEMLGCRCIDIVTRQIGFSRRDGNPPVYDIVCDDEGLLKDPQKISAVDDLGQPMLVGSLFIVGAADDTCELQSLDPHDIEYLRGHIAHIGTHNFPDGYPMLVQCAYPD